MQSGKLGRSQGPSVFWVHKPAMEECLYCWGSELGTKILHPRQVDWSNSTCMKVPAAVAWALDCRNLGAQGEGRQSIWSRTWLNFPEFADCIAIISTCHHRDRSPSYKTSSPWIGSLSGGNHKIIRTTQTDKEKKQRNKCFLLKISWSINVSDIREKPTDGL